MTITIKKFKYIFDNKDGEFVERFGIFLENKDGIEIKERDASPYNGGFGKIDPNNKSHGIQTIIRADRVDTFYKLTAGEQVIFYKKHLPKNEGQEVEFAFDINDIVEKNETSKKGEWKYKKKQDFIKG